MTIEQMREAQEQHVGAEEISRNGEESCLIN
jgi:hypothetical protein